MSWTRSFFIDLTAMQESPSAGDFADTLDRHAVHLGWPPEAAVEAVLCSRPVSRRRRPNGCAHWRWNVEMRQVASISVEMLADRLIELSQNCRPESLCSIYLLLRSIYNHDEHAARTDFVRFLGGELPEFLMAFSLQEIVSNDNKSGRNVGG
jgi:hypothetical protein